LVEKFDLSSLRAICSGAAPLDADLAQAAQDRLRRAGRAGANGGADGVTVVQGYGMTELSPVSHTTPDATRMPDGVTEVPKGSVGFALPNTECRLIDPATGEDAALGRPGELWVRGPQVMKGYLNNPQATADTLDAEGWLHTGDVAVVDENGCYTVVDRVKELIKYKGYQVAPAELEAVLIGNPQIADAAVIGIKDEASGEELPKAFVVRAPGSEITEQEVMDYVAGRLAPHKKVRAVEFIEQVPKSSAGKILRKDLKARAR
jgi:acyl-CoA synthetase (AMP-forming)/AMP-acid ligase II